MEIPKEPTVPPTAPDAAPAEPRIPDGFPVGRGAGAPDSAPGQSWERGVLEKLALAAVDEQRRARRWTIFFRLALLAVVALGLVLAYGEFGDAAHGSQGRHTALVDLKGAIGAEGEASAESIIGSLRTAFEDTGTVGVVLRINSPGGSPVQAGIIYDEMRRLRAIYPEIALHVVVDEMCASGGYYVAAGADRIYVDKASLVGSIGVLMDGFGFTGTMEKAGVERRLLTAGRNKGFLDSFAPVSEEHRAHAQTMLDEIHHQFIDAVKHGRGQRLKETPEMFSGLIWTGARSIELGLADAIGTVDSVARDVFKAEDIVDFSPHENIAERLAKKVGASMGQTLARTLGTSLALPSLR